MNKRAVIFVGLSASGKSTIAGIMVRSYGYTEINRDNVRFTEILPGGSWEDWYAVEDDVRIAREAKVTATCHRRLLECIEKGRNVVLSDTNLYARSRNRPKKLLEEAGYEVTVCLVDAMLEECIWRDAGRGKMSVGEATILRQKEQLDRIDRSVFNWVARN